MTAQASGRQGWLAPACQLGNSSPFWATNRLTPGLSSSSGSALGRYCKRLPVSPGLPSARMRSEGLSFPDPAPLRGKEGRHFVLFKSCDTCLCACAFQQRARDRIVSCLGGGVWVAVTRDFERDICVTSEILQSDWTLPNRAPVPRKSFVRESREGLWPRLVVVCVCVCQCVQAAHPLLTQLQD